MDWTTLILGFLGGIVFTVVVAVIVGVRIYKATQKPKWPTPPPK